MPIVPQNIPKPQQNRTEVGVRSLRQSGQPAALKKGGARKTKQKTDTAEAGILDRVSREESNMLVEEVGDEQRRRGRNRQGYAELEPVAGHATTMLRRDGRAFRRDEAGRTLPPHFSDVEQGNLQDAWLLASFAAVAARQPGALVQRFSEADKKGDFMIRLGEQTFPVSPEFPTEGYAEAEPRNLADTLWVALLEKAFALDAACSYAELETGNPGRALDKLLDGRSLRHRVRLAADPARQVAQLRAYRQGENAMVLVSRTGSVAAPFVADHAYAVVDVEANGDVQLYNPWGTRRASRPLESVVHRLPWARARQAFEFLYVGGIA